MNSIVDDIECGRLDSFLGGVPEGIVVKNYGTGTPHIFSLYTAATCVDFMLTAYTVNNVLH